VGVGQKGPADVSGRPEGARFSRPSRPRQPRFAPAALDDGQCQPGFGSVVPTWPSHGSGSGDPYLSDRDRPPLAKLVEEGRDRLDPAKDVAVRASVT
jgi:hypothetical protein